MFEIKFADLNEDYICFILCINVSTLCDELFLRKSKYDLNFMYSMNQN